MRKAMAAAGLALAASWCCIGPLLLGTAGLGLEKYRVPLLVLATGLWGWSLAGELRLKACCRRPWRMGVMALTGVVLLVGWFPGVLRVFVP